MGLLGKNTNKTSFSSLNGRKTTRKLYYSLFLCNFAPVK